MVFFSYQPPNWVSSVGFCVIGVTALTNPNLSVTKHKRSFYCLGMRPQKNTLFRTRITDWWGCLYSAVALFPLVIQGPGGPSIWQLCSPLPSWSSWWLRRDDEEHALASEAPPKSSLVATGHADPCRCKAAWEM